MNGSSIKRLPLNEMPVDFTVYHVETEHHEVIMAECVPAETYIDYAGRQAFDNYAEYLTLYGDDATISELAYPRISSARLLPAGLKTRLGLARAA